MRFRKRKWYSYGRKKGKMHNVVTIVIVSIICMVCFSIYVINDRLMPTYLQYAEVQTFKVASYVVSKAINSRTSNVLDVNDISEDIPPGTSEMMTTKFNTEIINRVRAAGFACSASHTPSARCWPQAAPSGGTPGRRRRRA